MLTDLNLTRVFVAIYEAGSLTAAGRRLFVTQSAISQSLARLRRELGDPLFERTAQGMRPTALADAIYPELHEGMSVIDRTIAAVTGFDPADSSGGRNEFCELLRWCQIAERFAWSSVERVLDRGQLSAGDDAQIGALRQVLA